MSARSVENSIISMRLFPVPKLSQTSKITTVQKVTTQVTIAPKVLTKLRTALAGYPELKRKMDYAKVEMSMARNSVLAIGLEDLDGNNFEVDGFKIALVTDAETKKLDQDGLKKLLLSKTKLSLKELDDLFKRCTKITPTAAYAKISPPGAPERDDA